MQIHNQRSCHRFHESLDQICALKPLKIVPFADSVVRTHFYKYFHPKEALIANGVLNRCVIKTEAGRPVSPIPKNFLPP